MQKHSDGAFVVGFVGIMMDEFMQRGARHHHVQQQDNAKRQQRNERLAAPHKMTDSYLQIICSLARSVPQARALIPSNSGCQSRRNDMIVHGAPLVRWTA